MISKISKAIMLLFAFTILFSLSPKATAASTAYAGRVSTKETSLNVRSSPSVSSARITTLTRNSTVTLIKKSGSWWYVEYDDNKYGWCHENYITPYNGTYKADVKITSGHLNVRSNAGTAYAIKDTLLNGEDVVVISTSGSWSRIVYKGSKTGYVYSSYLRKSGTVSIKLDVPSFKQTDSRWSSYPIGTTGGTIGSIGCTTTALAMTESYHTGTTVTPVSMAKKLSYSASGSLYWPSYYSVELAYSDYAARIYKLLEQGKPVVFGAKKSNGSQHWVTVTGYSGPTDSFSLSDFTINDPGSSTRKTLAEFMSVYPNAYKIVHRK